MVKGFATIADFQAYWQNCEAVYLQSSASQHYKTLAEPLSNLYSHMLEYQIQAICHLSKKQLSRAWQKVAGGDDWAAKEKNITELNNRCNTFVDPLHKEEIRKNWATQNETLGKLCRIEEEILKTMRDQEQNDNAAELLQALKSKAGDYVWYMEYNEIAAQGTCQWFFADEAFTSWRDDSNSGVFWVTAGPGCGKSVLARTLVMESRLKGTVVATADIASSTTISSAEATLCYFFFKDDVPERAQARTALCAVLHQLLAQTPSAFMEHGLSSFSKNGEALTNSFEDLWSLLLACAESSTGDIICILDALDECKSQDRLRFVEKLDRLYAADSAAARKLKFLITSRPYDDIEESFRPLENRAQYFRFDADERHEDISHDIRLVIDAKMESFSRDFNETERQKIAQSLKSRGTKTYLWLHLTLDLIKRRPSRHKRLRDVEALLSELPTKVSDAYEKILNRSCDEEEFSTEEEEKYKCIILQIVLAAARPLTLEEANYALTMADCSPETHSELEADRWKGDFKTTVKNLCGLVISVYDGKLFFIHSTAREFLVQEPDPSAARTSWRGRFADQDKLHEVILRCSMAYLLLSDFSSMKDPLGWHERNSYPLLEYAAVNWVQHFKAQTKPTAHLLQQARSLCHASNNSLSIWLPIYLWNNGGNYSYYVDLDESGLGVASFLGLDPIVEEIIAEGETQIDSIGIFGTPLQSAVLGQSKTVVASLLESNADVHATCHVQGDTPLALATLQLADKEITKLLLLHGADPLEDPPDRYFRRSSFDLAGKKLRVLRKFTVEPRNPKTLLEVAADNCEADIFYILMAKLIDIASSDAIVTALETRALVDFGQKSVALLADLLDDGRFESADLFTREKVRALMTVQSVGEKTLRVLAKKRQLHVLIDSAILKSACEYGGVTTALKKFFAETAAPCADITQAILEAVAAEYDPDILKLFLDYSPTQIRDVPSFLVAAAGNHPYQRSLTKVVFEVCGDAPDLGSGPGSVLSELMRREHILFTAHLFIGVPTYMRLHGQDLILHIVRFYEDGSRFDHPSLQETILQIFDRYSAEATLSEDLLVKVTRYCKADILDFLLSHFVYKPVPIQQLFEASAANYLHGEEVMRFLLARYGLAAVDPSQFISSAMSYPLCNKEAVELLLKSSGNEIRIAAETLASVPRMDYLVMLGEWLGEWPCEVVAATLLLVSDPGPHSYKELSYLLSFFDGSLFQPTEELVVNILTGSSRTCWNNLQLLIEKAGDRIVVNERILRAAAGCGPDTFEMIESLGPNGIQVTPEMIEEAVIRGDEDMLDYLTERSGGKFAMDDEMRRLAEFHRNIENGRLDNPEWCWRQGPGLADLEDARGRTALHRLLEGFGGGDYWGLENRDLLIFLVQVITVDINARTKTSGAWTPLQLAVGGTDVQTVQILLDAGADATMANGRGETAISLVESGVGTNMDRDTLLAVLKGEGWVAIEPMAEWNAKPVPKTREEEGSDGES